MTKNDKKTEKLIQNSNFSLYKEKRPQIRSPFDGRV